MTLPNFLIIGVAKAGTTSLYHYLDQHPQVYMCPVKETNYFGYEDARNWIWKDQGAPPALKRFRIRTLEEYQALFAGVSDEIAIGEASPFYFGSPTAATRIYQTIPDAMIVAVLRNPADRAYSGFLMRTRRGEAVKDMYKELTPDSSHVKVGYYYHPLKNYFDVFPRHQIKIYIFEEFKRNQDNVIKDLFEFLGVETDFLPDTSTKYNSAAVPKYRMLNRLLYNSTAIRIGKSLFPKGLQELVKRGRKQMQKNPPKFSDDLRANLLDLYREDILNLEDLLERDLSVWMDERAPQTLAEQNYVGNYQGESVQ